MAKISATLFVMVVIGLLIGLGAVLTYALVVNKRNNEAIKKTTFNPFCPRLICGTPGVQPTAVKLEDDPQKAGFITLNYCTSNAPSSAFVKALDNCGKGSHTEEHKFFHDTSPVDGSRKRIEVYKEWHDTYDERCGYGWGTSDDTFNEEATTGKPFNDRIQLCMDAS